LERAVAALAASQDDTATRTVVLVCGGRARRLDIPFAKELLPIAPGVTAVDGAIELARACGRPTRIVVVVQREKTDIFAHMARYADTDDIIMVHQRSTAWEACSAASSAAKLFAQDTVVLLPDHVFAACDSVRNPVALLFDCLGQAPVAYAAAPIRHVPWAPSAGVLKLDHGCSPPLVTDYAEHPARPEDYDVVWAAFAFRREIGAALLSTMERAKGGAKIGQKELVSSGIIGAPVVMISSFLDIGEWERYIGHWKGL
jgi:hypothetical protein